MILQRVRRASEGYNITHKKHRCGDVNLAFRTKDDDEVTRRLLIGESDDRVGLMLDIMDENALLSEQCTLVPTGDGHALDCVVLVLS